MSYAEVTELDLYTGNTDPDSTAGALALRQVFLDAAKKVIDDYVGYSIHPIATYSEAIDGGGLRSVALGAQPVSEIVSVLINGEAVGAGEFYISDNILTRKSGTFPVGVANINVEYKAGESEIPAIVKLTCLRIAALMSQEQNGNIGITSKSGPGDIGSRTFINYTSYNKYLSALDGYRIVRF